MANPYNPLGIPAPRVPFDQPKSLYRYGELTVWSTFRFAAAAAIANSTNRLFTTPRGQNGQGFAPLTISETSIKEGGRVPSGLASKKEAVFPAVWLTMFLAWPVRCPKVT